MARNSSAFDQGIPAGTHLWAAIRTAMATTQPTHPAVIHDHAQGFILKGAASGALTGLTTITPVLFAASNTADCPELTATMD